MNTRLAFLALTVLVLSCLVPVLSNAQYYPYPPQRPYYYGQEERERMKEERERYYDEREREREWRREERRRERAQQEWYDEQWRWYTQRYFGGAIQPYPGESYEAFARRARQQCNAQWNRCATYCNTMRDPYWRASCVANCNNELYECNAQFGR